MLNLTKNKNILICNYTLKFPFLREMATFMPFKMSCVAHMHKHSSLPGFNNFCPFSFPDECSKTTATYDKKPGISLSITQEKKGIYVEFGGQVESSLV